MDRRSVLGLGLASLATGATHAATATSADCASDAGRHEDLILVPMRDGVRIALSLWLPAGAGPFPAILMRSLDRRRYAMHGAMRQALLDAGYAVVSSDVRGRFESEGAFDPSYGVQDGRDGYDTIEWMAKQPWCDGQIGTFGLSHMAYYQTSLARENPPHLKAMATWTGGYRMGRSADGPPPRAGGVVRLSTTLVWLSNEAGVTLDRLEAEKQERMTDARQVLARVRTHPHETFDHLPLLDAPVARFEGLKELFEYRLRNDSRIAEPHDAQTIEAIRTPVFHECGWFDHAAWGQLTAFNALTSGAGTEAAREGQHMVIGPWQHAMVFPDRLGSIYFGPAATNAGSGIDRLQVQFFDKYVRGLDVKLPRVRYFVMGANEWRTADTWPPAHVARSAFYLRSGGKANSAVGDGVLNATPPNKNETPDRFSYDPHHPVPTLGGSFSAPLTTPGVIPGPIEQLPIERREDVLCYTSAPFLRDVEISGPVVLHLFAATSAVDTDFTAKLTHVYPDGTSYNIAEGILRLSGRNFKDKQPVTPHEIYEFEIGLGHTSIEIAKGHRIRLQVSSSSFPQWDRNMNTGGAIGADAKGVIAQQTIYHDAERASFLEVRMAKR